jgi:hypothetical protein
VLDCRDRRLQNDDASAVAGARGAAMYLVGIGRIEALLWPREEFQ